MARVLDIGAGYDPHPEATDAIDAFDQKALVELGKKEGKSIPARVAYRFGVDMNAGLPYPAGTFQKVVSRFSLATFGKPKAFREAHRVLKPGGILETWVGDAGEVADTTRRLRGARFTQITTEQRGRGNYRIAARKPLP